MIEQQQNLGRKFGNNRLHLSPQDAKAAVRTKVVILLLLIHCLLLLQSLESWLLYIIIFLTSCNCKCSVALPHGAVGVSMVCPDHTRLLFDTPNNDQSIYISKYPTLGHTHTLKASQNVINLFFHLKLHLRHQW